MDGEPGLAEARFPASDYDLEATLNSGQVFRWQPADGRWVGVVGARWVRLSRVDGAVLAEAVGPVPDWGWLSNYLQAEVELERVLRSFPDDEPMRAAVAAHRGLRLLRQDPWECLASFILSSTKQIVQIRQVVARVCARFGEPLEVPPGQAPAFAFPSPARLAEVQETELRACKMGFRAPYLRSAARKIAGGQLDLSALGGLPIEAARAGLMALPGVGRKIADCVLLFAYGMQSAFPVDVWVLRGLRELYFRRRRATLKKLQDFGETHFGPNAGYAQQYLFHYMRMKKHLPDGRVGDSPL
ncbi:MAG TPA: DNA glycosylase [Verrucomicrobiae bacterium]